MGRLVGVERSADGLKEALDSIRSFAAYVMPHQFDSIQGWELQNMLLLSACIVDSALARTESRGVHFRNDFPSADDQVWRRHLTIQMDVAGGQPQASDPLLPLSSS